MNKQILFFLFIAISIIPTITTFTFAQQDTIMLKKKLEALLANHSSKIGIGIIHIESGQSLSLNNDHHYPMQSVYKFPLALCVLNSIDKKKFTLHQSVHIRKEDLSKNTWSPLMVEHPELNFDLSISEILAYTISKSDNNTCDILFKLVNGTKEVNQYIHDLGIQEIAVNATEYEMSKQWKVQYSNWVQPLAMCKLLQGFFNQKYLSANNTDFLMQLMIATITGPDRIKGLLPKEMEVAHKTGTSNTNEKGVTAAVNDVGIITLTSGDHLALSIFISDTSESIEDSEKLIAVLSKVIVDSYSQK
jgi:beta-lactamase class A